MLESAVHSSDPQVLIYSAVPLTFKGETRTDAFCKRWYMPVLGSALLPGTIHELPGMKLRGGK